MIYTIFAENFMIENTFTPVLLGGITVQRITHHYRGTKKCNVLWFPFIGYPRLQCRENSFQVTLLTPLQMNEYKIKEDGGLFLLSQLSWCGMESLSPFDAYSFLAEAMEKQISYCVSVHHCSAQDCGKSAIQPRLIIRSVLYY